MSKWAKASMLKKRLSGFASYLLCAFSALIYPVEIDKVMLKVLQDQFKEKP